MVKYAAITSISTVLRWTGIGLMIMAGIVVLFALAQTQNDQQWGAGMMIYLLFVKLGVAISLTPIGLLLLAFGETIQVFVDTANNIAALVELSRQTVYQAETEQRPPTKMQLDIISIDRSDQSANGDRTRHPEPSQRKIRPPLDTSKWEPAWMEPFANGGGLIDLTRKVILTANERGYEIQTKEDRITISHVNGQTTCYSNADILRFAYWNDIDVTYPT